MFINEFNSTKSFVLVTVSSCCVLHVCWHPHDLFHQRIVSSRIWQYLL